jgi:transcriptional regulator with XRE-family HTH domain
LLAPARIAYRWLMSEIARIYPPERGVPEPLWREVLGSRLRALRGERDETLAQTAERAGISPQYLSEIERGRKEPSSEMIAALAGALGITVAELMAGAAEDLRQTAASVLALTTSTGTTSTSLRDTAAGAGTVRMMPARQRPAGPVALAMAA